MKILFLFGYIKYYSSDYGGGPEINILGILELTKSDPEYIVSSVQEELRNLIINKKLRETLVHGMSEEFFSYVEKFFGEFSIVSKKETPDEKVYLSEINLLFKQSLYEVFK